MANIRSQIKRIHRSERERLENRRLQSAVKTHFRRLESAVELRATPRRSADEHRELVSRIDKAVQKGALHRQQRRPQEVPRRPPAEPRRRRSGHGSRRLAAATMPPPQPAPAPAPAARRTASVSATSSGYSDPPRVHHSRSATAHVGGAELGRRAPSQPPDQHLRRVGVHREAFDSTSCAAFPPRVAASAALRLAQPSRRLVDERRDRLALGGQPLGGPDRRAGVAGDDRVRERPGGLLGGVGDHRLEVVDASTSPSGPAQSASRSSSLASRRVPSPIRSTSTRAAAGSSRKPRLAASATSLAGRSRACGAA